MKKLKLLWFGLVPLGWFISLRLIVWISNYPISWENPSLLGPFLILTGVIGTLFFIVGAFVIAIINFQD